MLMFRVIHIGGIRTCYGENTGHTLARNTMIHYFHFFPPYLNIDILFQASLTEPFVHLLQTPRFRL